MGRRKEVLDNAVNECKKHGIKAIGIQGDVRSGDSATEAVKKVLDHFGKLDILVNGAAGNFLCHAEGLSTNAFKTGTAS